jgi:hypothetical protein
MMMMIYLNLTMSKRKGAGDRHRRRNKVKVLMLILSNKESLKFDRRGLGLIIMKMVLMIRWKGHPLPMKMLLQQAEEISRKAKTVILRTKRTRKLQKRK